MPQAMLASLPGSVFLSRAASAAGLVLVAGCAAAPPAEVPAPSARPDPLSWILRLEDERRLADPPPPTLAGPNAAAVPAAGPPRLRPDLRVLLEAPAAHLRRRAALAVGRVGSPAGVEALVARLADPVPEVRRAAAFGLGLIGDAGAADALVDALADPEPRVQGGAAQALGMIGARPAAAAIGAMVRRHVAAAYDLEPDDLTHPLSGEVEAFRLGVQALAELQAFEPLAEAVLTPEGRPILWWWPVADALGRTEDRRAVPALEALAAVPGRVAPALAARGLGTLGDPRGVEALERLLDVERRGRFVVFAALRALGAMDHPAAVAALDRFVRVRGLDRQLRRAAVEALAHHAGEASVEVFVELLGHPWPPLRAAALRALSRADPQRFVFALSGGLGADPDWRVRAAAAEGLGRADPAVGRDTLTAMLGDPDERVLPAVLEALVAAGAPEAPGVLLERLQAPGVVVRAAAARLLGALRPPEAGGALAAAYAAAESDASFAARAAIVEALGAAGGAAAGGALRRALDDRDWAVRVRAAEQISRTTPEDRPREEIGPAPGAPGLDYAAPRLTNPPVSPHVFIETARGAIQIELAVLEAPLTADRFAALARQGFFDGLTFHRVVPGEAVHGGDPRGDGRGGPGFTLRDEPSALPFLRGTVGLARDHPDAGGSRFFITLLPQPRLDGRRTAFARVVAGMEVVDALQTGDRIERVLVWDGVQPLRGAGDPGEAAP